MGNMKLCARCQKEKPKKDFWADRKSRKRDGLQSHCKRCSNDRLRKEWYPKNRERKIKAVVAYKKNKRLTP